MNLPCPCCASESSFAFSKVVFRENVATYMECSSCRTLWVKDPTWLRESHENYRSADKADGGALWRSRVVSEALTEAFGSIHGPWLDYGSGPGHLSGFLARFGIQMLNYDPYRGVDQSGGSLFSMISCIETIEHVPDPPAFIRGISERLEGDGVLVMSTCLRIPAVHGDGWGYLAPEFGQHVTLMTRPGLVAAARVGGMVAMGRFVCLENDELQLHILTRNGTHFAMSDLRAFRWESYLNSSL